MNNTNNELDNYVDLLNEDKPIAGQKFVCISFISPENIIKDKQQYYFERFLKNFEFSQSMKKYEQFLHFIAYKYKIKNEEIINDFKQFVEEEKDSLKQTNISDEFKTFVEHNEENLEKEFNELYNFQTNTRGIKVRGVFGTQEEAEMRCKLLREQDPHHDIYVGPVGLWMPWEPDAYKTGKVEYLEKELNRLMHEKATNEERAKQEFEKRVAESKKQMIEENIKKAKEHGNKLTQNVDEHGNLINLNDNENTITRNLLNTNENEVIDSSDLKKELFEGGIIDRKRNN